MAAPLPRSPPQVGLGTLVHDHATWPNGDSRRTRRLLDSEAIFRQKADPAVKTSRPRGEELGPALGLRPRPHLASMEAQPFQLTALGPALWSRGPTLLA